MDCVKNLGTKSEISLKRVLIFFSIEKLTFSATLNLTLKLRSKLFSFIPLMENLKVVAPLMISPSSNLRNLSSLINLSNQLVFLIGLLEIVSIVAYSTFRPQQFSIECCHIAGWGKTEARQDLDELPNRLQVSSIPTKPASVCKREYPNVDLSMFNLKCPRSDSDLE